MCDLRERLALSRDRVAEIKSELDTFLSTKIPAEIRGNLRACFAGAADYLGSCFFVIDRLGDSLFSPEGPGVEDWKDISTEEWKEINRILYAPLMEGAYAQSYANPDMAVKLGTYGEVLSFLLAEIYSLPGYIFDGQLFMIVTLTELFLEIYGRFGDEDAPAVQSLEEAVRFHVTDYLEEIVRIGARNSFLPLENTLYRVVMQEDLSDPAYLYKLGEYISDTELEMAAFLNTLSEEEIDAMAATFVDGYRRGFDTMRVPFAGKTTVGIRYILGQERMIRRVIRRFEEIGLKPILTRVPGSRVNLRGTVRKGITGTPASRQFIYDHRMDEALFLDPQYVDRKLSALRKAYEELLQENADVFTGYAGPAVVESFGEETFMPAKKEGVITLSEQQQELSTTLYARSAMLLQEFLPGESYSFSIIAWPSPEIGSDFREIFRDTVRINTLKNEEYIPLQQKLIDAMDPADHILVEGCGENRTRMRVKMRKLADPAGQTQYENCVADVNIPLGEVFTSPVLSGTEGTLHVSGVYLNGYYFKDLEIVFKDGMVSSYSCGNYADEEAGRAYIRENILFNHETLPIGEFAIGTNMPAYFMAKKYDILGKLPILIVEKTGPHFALGDTCYSHSEDTAVFNPDGKEIISRENDFSLLRDTAPEKAYFNCHTDITIPYREIGRIAAVYPDGREKELIRDGRFVLPGTEALNREI